MAPWKGPRHKSWASNTNAATVALAIIFATWLGFEIVGDAPATLNQLLGATAGIWFGAIANDKAKRDNDTERTAERADATADRAEAKADELKIVAEREHPGSTAPHGEESPT